MVSIALLEYLDELAARKINALEVCIVCDVIDQAHAGYASCHLAALGIDYH
jgi:hypothetical protein